MNVEQAQRTLRQAVHQMAAALATNNPIFRLLLDSDIITVDGKLFSGFSHIAWSNSAEEDGTVALAGGFVILIQLIVRPGAADEATTSLIAVAGETPDELKFTFWTGQGDPRTTGIVPCLHAPARLIESGGVHIFPLVEVLENFVLDQLDASTIEDLE